MSSTPRGERLIITLLGNRNSGKSSLINALTNQEIAIVSEVPGTTTDPVAKRYELLPLGPVTFYDTAGLDDMGELGEKRIRAAYKVLFKTDMAIFVNDGSPFQENELKALQRLKEMKLPVLVIFNKSDLRKPHQNNIEFCQDNDLAWISVSATTKENITVAKEKIIELAPFYLKEERPLVRDIVHSGDRVILVTPIDASAPKGRLILPQVQVLRDLLDSGAVTTVVREFELNKALKALKSEPDLVITDSQVIQRVVNQLPPQVPLTTFSILFARYKGDLEALIKGCQKIDELKDGDRILIAEACSHHPQKDDIGRTKIPNWLKNYTQKDLNFDIAAGSDFPDNLEDYALIIHCGACMLNQKEMNNRIREAERRGVPITNYGLAISKLHGYFERTIAPLKIPFRA
ncbi:MAG TPA: [FeFe] hydrogenase H-cluster maturation GTPase HydF [Candidatus Syntrophosphaera thermopropionivorans]|nr:[FeFe] hydrogenase H-cluster maturation GTPase HydF [Candidatus Syntrophosphaera thermopropionivorans]